jgi:transcription elongation factor GreA
MAKGIQVTKEGYEKLKKELDELQGPVRMAIAEAIREAKSHGDLRENAAYHEAKLNQTRLEMRISDLEKALMHAKIVERPEVQGEAVVLGSIVTVEDLEFGDTLKLTIVGSFEADPANDLISIGSPLGEALLGRVAGDKISVEAPGGSTEYKVIKVEG